MSKTDDRILEGNCYIGRGKAGPCVIGFKDAYEPNLIIPDHITWIKDFAFNRYYGMETVRIPDSVDYIGEYAFCRCSSLRKVVLGKNVKTLRDSVFDGCQQLTEADFSHSQIEVLPSGIFRQCKKLHTIKLPKTLKKIAAHTLYGAPNVISMEFNEGLKVIEEMNLEGLENFSIINLPDTLIYIPDLQHKRHIKTILLSREQHERFAEYLPEQAKIIYKD